MANQEFTPVEFAMLAVTNADISENSVPNGGYRRLVLTTKEAYLWAAAVGLLVENLGREVTREVLRQAFIDTANKFEIRNSYLSTDILDSQLGAPGLIIIDFLDQFLINVGRDNSLTALYVINAANDAYKALLQRGLIEDPLRHWIGSILISVIAFSSLSFTQQTRLGTTEYGLRVRTPVADVNVVDRKEKQGDSFEFDLNIHAADLAKNFLEDSLDILEAQMKGDAHKPPSA